MMKVLRGIHRQAEFEAQLNFMQVNNLLIYGKLLVCVRIGKINWRFISAIWICPIHTRPNRLLMQLLGQSIYDCRSLCKRSLASSGAALS